MSGAPHTYTRLKDIKMGFIPEPDAEESIQGETLIIEGEKLGSEASPLRPQTEELVQRKVGEVTCDYFMDNDYRVATDFFPSINFCISSTSLD